MRNFVPGFRWPIPSYGLADSVHPFVQMQHTSDGAVNTGTTTIPWDDSIPQITEGDEYMTLAITPERATNRLVIEVEAVASNSNAGAAALIMALFQDATAGALRATADHDAKLNDHEAIMLALKHEMAAGTTSATTFRVRIGASAAGTTTFNGTASARKLGGVMASSITIREYRA